MFPEPDLCEERASITCFICNTEPGRGPLNWLHLHHCEPGACHLTTTSALSSGRHQQIQKHHKDRQPGLDFQQTLVDAVRMLLLRNLCCCSLHAPNQKWRMLRSGSWCCDVPDTVRKVFYDIKNLSNIYKQNDYTACLTALC